MITIYPLHYKILSNGILLPARYIYPNFGCMECLSDQDHLRSLLTRPLKEQMHLMGIKPEALDTPPFICSTMGLYRLTVVNNVGFSLVLLPRLTRSKNQAT